MGHLFTFTFIGIGLISVVFLWIQEQDRTSWKSFMRLTTVRLVIAIPSSRNNVERRKTFRETWFSNLNSFPFSVTSKFIVGIKTCQIPPDDRWPDIYDCSSANIDVNKIKKPLHFANAIARQSERRQSHTQFLCSSFSFKVQHDVIVNKLGVLSWLLQNPSSSAASVVLQISGTQDEIATVKISPEFPGVLVDGYIYRPVEALLLPRGFEGTVRLMEPVSTLNATLDPFVMTIENNGGGVLQLQHVTNHVGICMPFASNHIPATSMGFKADDPQSIQERQDEKRERQRHWDMVVEAEERSLQAEMAEHEDIVFVDMIDVYRNLPRKMLGFYEWVVARYRFDYLLKVDDDSIVDIEKLVEFLKQEEEKTSSHEHWWLGKFRYNWIVERHGKWREPEYNAVVYPPFACGAANALSYGLVRWLAANSKHLHSYQGEDVSTGIWASAIRPTLIQDERMQCDEQCSPNSVSRGQQSPDEIRNSWNRLQKCGQLCSCDIEGN